MNGINKKGSGKVARASQPPPPGTGARQDKPVIEDKPATDEATELDLTATDPFDVAEDIPASLAPRPRKLAWSYSLLREVDSQSMDDLLVEPGTKIAIEGTLERLGYLYVVQVGDDKSIEILFPPNGGPRRARPGMHIRLPGGTGWIVTTKKGKLRTITSSQPLSEADIAALV